MNTSPALSRTLPWLCLTLLSGLVVSSHASAGEPFQLRSQVSPHLCFSAGWNATGNGTFFETYLEPCDRSKTRWVQKSGSLTFVRDGKTDGDTRSDLATCYNYNQLHRKSIWTLYGASGNEWKLHPDGRVSTSGANRYCSSTKNAPAVRICLTPSRSRDSVVAEPCDGRVEQRWFIDRVTPGEQPAQAGRGPGPGTYRVRVKADGRYWHEDGLGDRLVSTRYQETDDFTVFRLHPQSDGGYRISVKAGNGRDPSPRYLREHGSGDRLLSTRHQKNDANSRFYFEPQQDGSYRIFVKGKASRRFLHQDGLGDGLVSTRHQETDDHTRFYFERQ